MIERIIDLSDRPARVGTRHGQLLIKTGPEEESSVPLAEVATLIVSNPTVLVTQGAMAGLLEAGGVFVVCDGRRMPVGMMTAMEGHHLHAERLRLQIEAGEPARKQAWQQTVRAKVLAQAAVLQQRTGEDRGLRTMAARVRSGDPDNLEAQAARKYWTAAFGPEFRRDRDAPGANALLNYGYMALRAVVARAIVAAGLHPALGIQHKNRYNAYSLADDLMEPFRPIIDRRVLDWLDAGKPAEVDVESKRHLLGALLARYPLQGEQCTLFDCAAATAVSLVRHFEGTQKQLQFIDDVLQ